MKITQEQLMKVRYTSMVDFSKKIDQLSTIEDKRKFATQYLLTYGLTGDADYSFAEAIHFVRAKLSESISEENMDLPTKVFLSDPISYLKGYALENISLIQKGKNDDDPMIEEHYHYIIDELNENMFNKVLTLDRHKNAFDVNVRMANKLGGKNELKTLVNNTKPGFFSRLFDTSSQQAKDLDKAYKAFNKPSDRAFGNLNALEEAAIAYLEYKIPNWNSSKPLPNLDVLNGLDRTSSARVLFSIRAIDAARSQRKIEDSFKGLGKYNTVVGIKFNKVLEESNRIDREKNEIEKSFLEDIDNEKNKLEFDQEMKLNDENFNLKEKDDQLEKLDPNNPINIDIYDSKEERKIVEKVDELGESHLDHDNYVKQKAEEERLKNYRYKIDFAEDELELDSNVDINLNESNSSEASNANNETIKNDESKNEDTLDSADFTENQI